MKRLLKSIAIPVSLADDKPRFLTVRDRRFGDWIFVTGGCRAKEFCNPLRCALRELKEETRGIINLKNGEYSNFSFRTIDKENPDIELIYHVYIIFLRYNRSLQDSLVKRFNFEKSKMDKIKRDRLPYKKTYDENDMMSFDTLDEFACKKMWERIVDNVINNPEFYSALKTLNKKSFNYK